MTVTIEGISFVNIRPIQQAFGSAELTIGQHLQGTTMSHRMGPDECRQLAQGLLQIAALASGQPTDEPKQEPQSKPTAPEAPADSEPAPDA